MKNKNVLWEIPVVYDTYYKDEYDLTKKKIMAACKHCESIIYTRRVAGINAIFIGVVLKNDLQISQRLNIATLCKWLEKFYSLDIYESNSINIDPQSINLKYDIDQLPAINQSLYLINNQPDHALLN